MGNSLIKTAVTEERWDEVEMLLREKHYNRTDIDEFITSCEAVNKFYVSDIVAHFSSFQQNRFITAAVKKRQWQAAGKMMQYCKDRNKRAWVIDEASRASDGVLVNCILPHVCSDDKLKSVLKHLVTRGMWLSVGTVLEKGVSDTLYCCAVQEALQRTSNDDFERCILLHCSDDDKELRHSVRNANWESVGKVLGKHVRCALDRWAVQEALERSSDHDFERCILPHCSDGQLESVLNTLVTRGMWQSVGKVFERCHSDTLFIWAVDKASKRAVDLDFERYILPHCSDDQLESVLKCLVTRGMWRSVGNVLERGVSDTLYRWTVEEASKRAVDYRFELYILPHCSGDQLESVLKYLVTGGMLRSVGRVLERGVRDTLYRWAVQKTLQRTSDDDFERYILPRCSDADKELRHSVRNANWESVGNALGKQVRCALDRWAVEEALERSSDYDFESFILPHCSDDQLEYVLKQLVTRRLWRSVGKVLESGVSDTLYGLVVQEACTSSSDDDFKRHILPRCSDADKELRHGVHNAQWRSVGNVLGKQVRCALDRWAFQEALERSSDYAFGNFILPHCSHDQLESVLKQLVTRHMWWSVGKVLGRGVSDTLYSWAVQEAWRSSSYKDFERYILPHCNVDHLESVLKQLVTRHMWRSVGKVLERGVSNTLYRWAVQEALESLSYKDFERYILPHCIDADKELRRAVHKAQWKSVGEVLATGVRCTLDSWAVEEASKRVHELDFECHILPRCSDADKELRHIVRNAHLESVGNVLGKQVRCALDRWAVEKALERSSDHDFESFILPHCSDDQLEYVLKQLVTRGMWQSVGKVLETGVSDTLYRWAIQEACEGSGGYDFERYILPHCKDDQLESVLKHLVTRRMWQSVSKVIDRGVNDTLYRWAIQEACEGSGDYDFERYILPHCKDDQLESVLKHLITRRMWQSVSKVIERGVSDTLYKWAVKRAWNNSNVSDFKHYILPHCSDDQLKSAIPHLIKRGLRELLTPVTKRGETLHMLVLCELCRTVTYYTVMKHIETLGQPSVQLLISCLSSGELTTEVKNVALRFALHQNKWDIIRKVSLSHVWEQVRRELFRAAVEQKRWSLVKKWADHTAYDNQRWWAQEEAYKKKQWDVMLLLTDYGMTDIELMRVRYRLAKYADWGVVVRMIERGVDVTEVREVVESAMISRKTARDEAKRRALVVRWHQLCQLEDHYTKASSGRVSNWSLVLFYLHRHTRRHPSLQQLLQRAIEDEAWHVVRHLLRLGLDTAQRDSLLTEMINRHQWGVCRVLLEQGVGVQSCLEALPMLMDRDQWTLVARVMEFNVGDDCRQRVMRRAMDRREGSVVWRCIRAMQHYRLCVEGREKFFQLAMSGGVWEVVKPLMEEVDRTGLRHRDTALLEAIEQHQWDVVDYCQWHKADINMKDDEGQTPLNRAGRKSDWKAVKELVIRGGDPNVPDIDKHCILNIVINATKWYLTRLIIEYHGHIHVVDNFRSTPLQLLIDNRKGEIIHHTLMWCPDQSKVVNKAGETTLHAIALDKRPELMYSQIVRGVNPLTLTKGGQSVLLYAVKNPHSAERMVAECIKLGFGTHQPQFNGQMTVAQLYLNVGKLIDESHEGESFTTSPLLWAVEHGQHVVAHMLYESGSCSYTQLLQLYTGLYEISDPFSEHGRRLLEDISRQRVGEQAKRRGRYEVLMKRITTFLPYMREMATTPRSLVSTCRLVISHHLDVRGRRERDVQQLPLTDRMKNYVLFSDLADPDYAWYLHGTLPPVSKESEAVLLDPGDSIFRSRRNFTSYFNDSNRGRLYFNSDSDYVC